MDKLTNLLKNYQVGIWCKRAAWIQLILRLVYVVLQFSIVYAGQVSPISLTAIWSLVQFLLPLANAILFDFFILYAAAVAVEHLTGTAQRVEDDEDDEDYEDTIAHQ
ncbi:hypothetical protein [Ktedonospora formicarum]|uniref:Uncharacterized protein n=1 Tax=Ktedonospora formicarum TaxID=2778364 RepID=A0A8J3HUA6_9CHLR|nr:hypothetical protein [Ktedonospora formicarum]GHO42106.1 hypothetical protein KSX_02690 [Ktedonospora formicarum]